MDERDLKEIMFKSLQHKRYLIVLDDIWKTDLWPLISPNLPDDKNGSRVMITTRFTDVARYVDKSTEPHHLRPLREDESRRLFTNLVFSGDDEEDHAKKECTGELREFSEKILKSCGGLPLAIVLMGGLLATREKRPSVWLDVVQGFSWEEVPGGQVFKKMLALSYMDLPHHLKTCFLYLGLFPEDFEIEADELIRLWIAEGFVPNHQDQDDGRQHRNKNNYRTMEETAEDWLEELVRRCLVQAADRTPSGILASCRMHDVLRDLCIAEASKSGFFQIWQPNLSPQPSAMTRRLALQGGTLQERCAPKLRTLLCFSKEEIFGSLSSPQRLMDWRLLRVLDLQFRSRDKVVLPNAIGDLIHLRYLGFGRTGWGPIMYLSIPPSVANLQNLQTLFVQASSSVLRLPDSFWQIKTLRHVLMLSLVGRIEPRLAARGQHLGNLQTLQRARAGGWIESSLALWTSLRRLSIDSISPDHHLALSNSLDSLVHLRVLSLSAVHRYDHVDNDDGDYRFGLLPRKALALPNHRRLDTLELIGRLMIGQDNYTSDEMPPNLSVIELMESSLQQDPLLLLEKLSYLRRLTLCVGSCKGEDAVLCSAGGFPQLEELELIGVQCLSRWTVEKGAMPRLRRLEINSCKRLERIPDGLQHLRDLQTLKIMYMPVEFVRRLRKDEDGGAGEDWHKIQHIPHVTITNY